MAIGIKLNLKIYLQEWEVVSSYTEFVAWIERYGLPDFISLEPDLGLPNSPEVQEQNGMSCAKWLVNYCGDKDLKLPNFVIHLQNPVGKKNLEGLLEGFRKDFK